MTRKLEALFDLPHTEEEVDIAHPDLPTNRETLAAIAGAKTPALIAALVADETKRIDAAVTAGKLTAAQATTLKAGLVAHVTEEVNSPAPLRGPKDGKGGKGGRGDHGPHGMGGGMGGNSGAPVIPAPTPTN